MRDASRERTTGLHQLTPAVNLRSVERRNALFYIPALAHFTVHLEFRLNSKRKSAGDEIQKSDENRDMKWETKEKRETYVINIKQKRKEKESLSLSLSLSLAAGIIVRDEIFGG